MNKILKTALVALLPLAAFAQDDEQPIITFRSIAYTEVGESNQFSILIGASEATYIDLDMGAGKNEVELEVANIDTDSGEWTGTWIPIRATEEGIVKIYGDASLIDVLVLDGGYITDIDFSACTNLEILSMEHNELQQLDLTPFTKLMAIYMTDNPFTESTPLIIGTPKPNLTILEVDIIDYLDPNFNLSDYPSMAAFDAYHTLGLKSIDPTGCPNLQSLSVEMTAVETIDVTKNPLLTSLNVSESRVTTLDLSGNPYLVYLMAGHSSGWINTDVKMDSIDLTHNPELYYVSLTGNNFTSLDLSKNTKIQNLYANRLKLTELDLSANVNLYSVNVSNNYMDIATLPLPQSYYGEYYYLQYPMEVDRSLAVGATLDLSDRVLREGTVTTASVMRKPLTGEAVEVDASLYEYADGKISFKSAIADSVYVVFANDVFSEYSQTTSKFRVKAASEIGKPSAILPLSIDGSVKTLNINVGVAGATEDDPKTFIIDFGQGTQTEYTTRSASIDELSAQSITVPSDYHGRPTIYMPEGNMLTAFAMDGVAIYNVTLTAATDLRELSLTNAEIYSIDLSYNRNLQYLDLSGNNLLTLSLNGIYGDYEKTVLTTLKAANNSRLATLELRDGSPIKVLDLSGNKFTELPMTEFDNALDVNISNNLLTGELSLTYQLNAQRIDISGNAVTSLLLDTFTDLQYFNASNTNLTLETLPLPSELNCEYVYSPLNDLTIQAKAPAVNLTSQNRVVDGVGTTFVWKKADGTVLEQGVDIDCIDGGTRFLNEDLGAIYCEMTNPAFPGLTLRTTDVTVVGAPTNVIATFTSTAETTGEMILRGSTASALYIDWRGDGTEYTEYPFSADGISSYEVPIYKDANAKIYTYGNAEDLTVFSLYSIPMSACDLSKLTALTAVSIGSAGLTSEQIILPEADLTELNLSGNKLTDVSFASKYPRLAMLNLSNNYFTSFDASVIPTLTNLYLANNYLTSVKFDNPSLWDIHLNGNLFQSVNLEGLSSAYQIFLNDNLLSEVDITPVSKSLRVLSLVGNRFTFATLPDLTEYANLTMFYGLQEALQAECVDGKVDLSELADIRGTATTYTWYLGEATLDADSGEYVGEELIADDEYTVEDGVTTFNYTFSEKVMCVMANDLYPNLLMTTERLTVELASSITEIESEQPAATGTYDLLGRRVTNPTRGLYIINGKKVLIR